MILGALADAGGQKYLREQASANAGAFMTLVGKVLPTQLTGKDGGPIRAEVSLEERKALASQVWGAAFAAGAGRGGSSIANEPFVDSDEAAADEQERKTG